MQHYDTSFLRLDKEQRARHGQLWHAEELDKLWELFFQGLNLQQTCEKMQRPAAGVLAKLAQLRILCYDTRTNSYSVTDRALRKLSPSQPTETKEHTMSNPNHPIVITEQTLVNGLDIKLMSNSELYGLIAAQEAYIEKLSKLKAQPQRLKAEIAERQQAINDLVELIDQQV